MKVGVVVMTNSEAENVNDKEIIETNFLSYLTMYLDSPNTSNNPQLHRWQPPQL